MELANINDILATGIQFICMVVIFILTKYIIPILKEKIQPDTLSQLSSWAKVFVQAAEMIIGSGSGKEKKEIVLDYLTAKAQELGIDISDIDLDAIIESAVYALKNNETKEE